NTCTASSSTCRRSSPTPTPPLWTVLSPIAARYRPAAFSTLSRPDATATCCSPSSTTGTTSGQPTSSATWPPPFRPTATRSSWRACCATRRAMTSRPPATCSCSSSPTAANAPRPSFTGSSTTPAWPSSNASPWRQASAPSASSGVRAASVQRGAQLARRHPFRRQLDRAQLLVGPVGHHRAVGAVEQAARAGGDERARRGRGGRGPACTAAVAVDDAGVDPRLDPRQDLDDLALAGDDAREPVPEVEGGADRRQRD